MAQAEESGQDFPQAPVMVSPRREERVDGSNITFSWEPIGDALGYRVQVAVTERFDEIILDERVGTETELHAERQVPTDGDTYYWRVLVQTEQGWSRGERVETFISVSSEDAASVERDISEEEQQSPEETEEMGPAAALFGKAGDVAAAEATGDVEANERLAREQAEGVAEEGVESGQILGLVAAVSVAVIIIVLLLFFWVDSLTRQARDAVVGLSGYPELESVEREGMRQLEQYEAIDSDEGVYRIPIERAMELMVREGYGEGSADAADRLEEEVRVQQQSDQEGQ